MRVANTAAPRNYALRQARKRREGEYIPGEVHLEVSYRCNLRCIHCYLEPYSNKPQPDELSVSEIAGILDQLFEIGTYYVSFSGGEPLFRPDIFQILEYARERGLFFGLKTNATLITESVADRLKKLGISSVHVSLYGAKPATHELVTRVAGSYARTIRAIKLLRERKIPVSIKTTIMKCNVGEHEEMENIARQLDASYGPDPLVFPKIGEPGSATGVRLGDEQLRKLISERNWVPSDAELLEPDLKHHLICGASRTRCAISPRGEVLPCTVWRIPLGDLRRQTFNDIWHGEAASKIRTIEISDLQSCANCELVHYCARCPGMIHMEMGNSGTSGPSPENCRLARAMKEVKYGQEKETLR